MGQTDSDMTQNDRTVAKDLTVDSKKVRTIDAYQNKNREIASARQRMLKLWLLGKDSHINVSEILISCF